MINKTGQFFLLGAVVIAAMIYSLGTISNQASFVSESPTFDHYYDNINQETNDVLSYIVNTGSDLSTVMGDWGDRLSSYVQMRNLNSDLVLIYGNSSELFVDNLGNNQISLASSSTGASPDEIVIAIPGITSDTLSSGESWSSTSFSAGDIEINYDGNIYNFAISDYNRVIVMLKEEFNDEIYIRVE